MHQWFARFFFCALLFLGGMGLGAEIERRDPQPAAAKGNRLDIVESVVPPDEDGIPIDLNDACSRNRMCRASAADLCVQSMLGEVYSTVEFERRLLWVLARPRGRF